MDNGQSASMVKEVVQWTPYSGEKVKVLNLRVLKVMPEKNLLLVKGCVPGHKNSYVIIQK